MGIFVWVAVALAIALGSSEAGAGTPIPGFVETTAAMGLNTPTAIAFLPDGRFVVTEKGGALKLVDGGAVSTLVSIPVCNSSEMGLLGVAIDPNFGSNGFIYLYRTKPPTTGTCSNNVAQRFNQVVRVTMVGNAVNIASLVELLDGAQTDNGNHDGGCLRIGPDGKLYVGVGDTGLGDNQGGPGSSTNPYSQDLAHLEGKVLRLNLDGTIPTDNPFFGQVGKRGEIFAYGFRNPFRFGFDPVSNGLWLADVGDATIEEIDIVTSGKNFSWPYCEGNLPGSCQMAGDVAPIFTYSHSDGLGTSITGGVFAGPVFGTLGSDYFFGDYTGSRLYYLVPTGGRNGIVGSQTTFVNGADGPVDLAFGPDNALYYVAINAGEVRRVAAVIAPPTDIDTYACYRAALAKGETPLPTTASAGLQDLFDGSPQAFGVLKAGAVCNPASRDGSTELQPAVHQESFGIKRPAGSPKFVQSAHVTIDDFGARDLTLTGPTTLLVPSNKVLGGGGAPPYAGTAVDHYKCYKAKLSKGQPKFDPPAAPTVTDEFFMGGQSLSVKKITKLCTPVASDGSVVNHSSSDLVCYQVKLPAGVKFPKTTVSTNNPDFGADVLVATAPSELCLPAQLDP